MNEHETFDMMAEHVRTIATEMITEQFGPRCPEYEKACEICRRWRLLDSLLNPDGPPHSDETIDELQTRIDELEDIIRASFVVWDDGDYVGLSLTRRELSDDTEAAIIEICKPRIAAPRETHDGSINPE